MTSGATERRSGCKRDLIYDETYQEFYATPETRPAHVWPAIIPEAGDCVEVYSTDADHTAAVSSALALLGLKLEYEPPEGINFVRISGKFQDFEWLTKS